MSDVVTDTTKLNGWFKYKYGKFQDAIPASEKLTSQLGKITKTERIGRKFLFPVELALPQGATYAAAGAGAFTINGAIAGVMAEASVDGSQIVVNDVLDYESAAKAVAQGEEAYGDAAGRVMKRLTKAGHKRVELSMWYGQTNIGIGSSVSGTSTTRTWVLTTASWAPQIWIGMQNMLIDIYSSSTLVTKRTSTAGGTSVTTVNVSARSLVITGVAGELTTLDSDTAPAFVPYASVGNDMAGVDKIVTTASGSLFGIAVTNEMWAGNTFDVGSQALTLKKIYDGDTDAAAKFGEGKRTIFTSLKTWANLGADQASMRKYDAKYSSDKAENGFRSITFFGQTGELEIVPYGVIKEGEAYSLPLDQWMKIGSQDLSFNVPGRGEQYFENLPTSAGYRIQMYAMLAIICGQPGGCTKYTNIVNS